MMHTINTPIATTTKINKLLDNIANTCDALMGALEMTTEQTSQYGGRVLESFSTEFVDVVIKTLVQLRLYTSRLHKEIANGLIKTPQDLALMVSGMQELTEKLDTLMLSNGALRNNFAFGIQEIQHNIQQILDEIAIN